jgi:peptidoglycan/xylan/chitin deacetylase (PgdA/CDA1 family)
VAGREFQHGWVNFGVLAAVLLAGLAVATQPADAKGIGTGGTASAPAGRLKPPVPHYPTTPYPRAGEVALTFDDGPRPYYTDQVMSILQREGIGGTFFVVGYVAAQHPDSLRKMHRLGFSVQNHSWNHGLLVNLNDDQLVAELSRVNRLISSATGVQPTVLRPPYGVSSPRLVRLAAGIGMETVIWNAQAPSMTSSAYSILGSVEGSAMHERRDGKGLLVLLHDGSGASGEMVQALPYLISWLRAHGWKFVQLG